MLARYLFMRSIPPTLHMTAVVDHCTASGSTRQKQYLQDIKITTRQCLPRRYDLYQRPSSEEACLVLLPVLAMVSK